MTKQLTPTSRVLASVLSGIAGCTLSVAIVAAAPNHQQGAGDYCWGPSCTPKRISYGHYQTNWRKWPGDVGLYTVSPRPKLPDGPQPEVPNAKDEAESRPRKRATPATSGIPEELPPEFPPAEDEVLPDATPMDLPGADEADELPDLDDLDTDFPESPESTTPPTTPPDSLDDLPDGLDALPEGLDDLPEGLDDLPEGLDDLPDFDLDGLGQARRPPQRPRFVNRLRDRSENWITAHVNTTEQADRIQSQMRVTADSQTGHLAAKLSGNQEFSLRNPLRVQYASAPTQAVSTASSLPTQGALRVEPARFVSPQKPRGNPLRR